LAKTRRRALASTRPRFCMTPWCNVRPQMYQARSSMYHFICSDKRREARAKNPIKDLRCFRSPDWARLSTAASFLTNPYPEN
jgi:hypothetical protein